MAINAGVNISKALGYAVLEIPVGVDITKAVAYAVLDTVNPPVWAAASAPSGIAGLAYSASFTLISPTLPVTFSLLSGSLPAGLALSGSGPVATISGTPTLAGVYPFTLRATNDYGLADLALSITIAAAPSSGGSGGSFTFIG